MSEDLLDEHNEIKSFKCIECQLILPESSRFQDKPVCITCVAEAGYEVPTVEEIVLQDVHEDLVETKAPVDTSVQEVEADSIKTADLVADKTDEKEIVQEDAVETKAAVNTSEQEAEVDSIKAMDVIADKSGDEKTIEQEDVVETKASEQEVEANSVKTIDVIAEKADDEKAIAQEDLVETKASDNISEQEIEVDSIKAVDIIADKTGDEKAIVQEEAHKDVIENKVSVNMPELKIEVDITKAEAAIAVENNTKDERIMSMTMVKETDWLTIAAGKFMMGSPDAAEDSDEQLHEVTVSGFRMLKTAVTFEQFDVFCKETGRGKYSDCKWGRGNRPVIFVSYWDAVDYAEWLSGLTGMRCRLPTEAEWEYACRAGTETTFNTGNTLSTAQANYDGYSPHLMISKGISRYKTMPTGTFPGNAWGLVEMHGNVCEWCASEYDPYYNGSEQLDGSIDRSNDVPRVLRGGSWNSRLETLRSAARMHSKPDQRSNEWGFRLVRIE